MSLVPNSVTRKVHRQILITKKQSPHIFFITGMLGAITSTVLACRATLKLSETLDEIQNDIQNVKILSHSNEEVIDMESMEPGVTVQEIVRSEYPDEQYAKDLVYVYAKASVRLTKLYGPSIIIGAASIGLLTSSHVQLARRNQALIAAYGMLQQAFNEYRERVQEEIGEERERDLYLGMHDETVTNELGKKEKVKVLNPNRYSMYAKVFCETNENWQKDPEYNRIFIQIQQNYWDQRLRARGHVFLNEVYDSLGFPHTKAGAVVGWLISPESDCFIDFGIYEAFAADFVNGYERSIVLDFNVDGVIYDQI
jgi:type II secretory pathway pseudopilin PulG